jgi:hypothetical protein
MAFTQDDATTVLTLVRNFYKGGLKSGTKMYEHGPKQRTRNDNAVAGEDIRAENRQKLIELGSVSAFARYLVDNNIKVGNCGEMAALACHYAAVISSDTPVIRYCELGDHHAFCMVMDRGARYTAESLDAVLWMKSAQMTGVYIIDPWMNLACEASDYFNDSLRKLLGWKEQGKVVANGVQFPEGDEPLRPNAIDPNTWHREMVITNISYVEP